MHAYPSTTAFAIRNVVKQAKRQGRSIIENPVTGAQFTPDDSVGAQVERADAARRARVEFHTEEPGFPCH
ncbi:hypothetical protein JYK14_19735 [Siccirubricoccus sp. KC 17139]|uniref:Aldehyde dehydrogenase family protein n=1 Tax=Siccirubricoccus soli TaxID=2899147 RepID=A0ABT1DB25_9PROT|nr:hypothetical protein [Siccirubricoccus soli]MCO6418379.1 hypothetical protein [Siccirubricoccus soli]MCP2684514.1 hypothetical protein [Siccirubricoccus soli]